MFGMWNWIHQNLVAASCHPAGNKDEVLVVTFPASTTVEGAGKSGVVIQTEA